MSLLAHWRHNLNPFIIEFGGGFGIRWYGVAYVLGILLAMWLIGRWQRRGQVPLTQGEVLDFIMVVAIGMLIGGRLGYFVFYDWDNLISRPWQLFNITSGGMASHGGVIGMTLAVVIYARVKGRSCFVLGDILAVAIPIGIFAGRVANFINGELWGRPSNVGWAVVFPGAPTVGGLEVPRHPSQLYAAVLEGVVLFAVLLWVHPRHRRPGLTVGICFAVYGLARFVDEFWREPNTGYELYFGWMTKGQALTVPLFIFAAWLIYRALRHPPRPDAYLPPPPDERDAGCEVRDAG
jgi:phosphatidylglycerol:prolipoprotein diacylglycerol transferase